EDQPARRVPPDPRADPRLPRAVLGAPVGGRAAAGALDPVDPRPVRARPVLRAAGDLRHHRVPAGEAVADADHRPRAGEGHADHADRLLGAVHLLPVGPRAVLAREQHPADRAAVAHEPDAREGSGGQGGHPAMIGARLALLSALLLTSAAAGAEDVGCTSTTFRIFGPNDK